jgi:1-phosphofructokinase
MASELGARPVLCCQLGGEVGRTLESLLQALPGERRITWTRAPSGSYIVDRRAGERELVASAARGPLQRHEVDDLVAATCAAAWRSRLLVVCNPYPADGLPVEVYATIVADVKAAGVPVIVDLSSPRLEQTLPYQPDLVKLNDWELAAYVYGPVDGIRALEAARRLCGEGARAVAVTRAGEPTLVVPADGDPYEIVPPPLPRGFREGCGDTMMGAVAAAWVQGRSLREALVLGAAAGSVNFMRHGLGTGSRDHVEEMAERIVIRRAQFSQPAAPAPHH